MRTPESVVLEAEYWELALADTKEINDHLGKMADATENLILLSVKILSLDEKVAQELLTTINEIHSLVLASQDNIMNLATLSDGRFKAIKNELNEQGGNE